MFPRDLILKTLLTAVCAAGIATAHSGGTTQASAGVPGEGSCIACHTLTEVGAGSITVGFADKSGTYQAGVSQRLTLTIKDAAAKRWGFQLTARLQSNQQLQAGTFTPGTDSQLFCTNIGAVNYSLTATGVCPPQQPLVYIEQTFDGTHIDTKQPGSQAYQFDWTPPSNPNAGTVVFYVAATASNNDGGIAGEITYATRYVVPPALVPTVPVITSVVNPSGVQSSITRGEVIVILGSGLASTSRTISTSELINGQYPQTADGVSVTIAGVPAYLLAIDPGRLKVIVPKTATALQTEALGLVYVVVTNGTQSTVGYIVDLESVAPAFFLLNTNYVMAVHLDGTTVAPVGTDATSSPAKPGETIMLTVTGLGPTTPTVDPGFLVPDGSTAKLIETPLVLFNGAGTLAQNATLVAGNAGVFAVTVQVAADAVDGDVPIQIQVSGVQSDAGFFLAIRR